VDVGNDRDFQNSSAGRSGMFMVTGAGYRSSVVTSIRWHKGRSRQRSFLWFGQAGARGTGPGCRFARAGWINDGKGVYQYRSGAMINHVLPALNAGIGPVSEWRVIRPERGPTLPQPDFLTKRWRVRCYYLGVRTQTITQRAGDLTDWFPFGLNP
jgi:hypothetical protein